MSPPVGMGLANLGTRALLVASVVFACLFVNADAAASDDVPEIQHVHTLTASSWEEQVEQAEDAIWLVEFYAPWCGHCKDLMPKFQSAAAKCQGKVNFGKVDCTVEGSLCKKKGIEGYPTIELLRKGGKDVRRYSGARTADAFVAFCNRVSGPVIRTLSGEAASAKSNGVVLLSQDGTINEDFKMLAERNFHAVEFMLDSSTSGKSGVFAVREGQLFNMPSGLSEKEADAWAVASSLPLVPEVDSGNFRLLTNGRIAVLGAAMAEDTQLPSFRKSLKTLARAFVDDQTVSFAWVDADRWSSFAAQYTRTGATAGPEMFLLDTKRHAHLKMETNELTVEGVQKLLDGVRDGTIPMEIPLTTRLELFVNDHWMVVLSVLGLIAAVPVYLLFRTEPGVGTPGGYDEPQGPTAADEQSQEADSKAASDKKKD